MPPKSTAPVILQNAGANSAELWFYAEFGPDWAGMVSADLVRRTLTDLGPGYKLSIHINSPGGDVGQAAAIYNILKNYDGKKTVEIDGMCWSCASWVAQAGDKRNMAENGLLMIHDPEGSVYGRAADMRREADLLDQVKTSIVGVYAARSGQTPEAIATAMEAETWYSAEDALAAGLIDAISPNKTVTMCGDASRFKNAPEWLKPLAPQTEPWKRANAERRQLLNELSL